MADKCPECPDEGLPGWMGTFADMMTLLFAFFVLLFSLSSPDPVKVSKMQDGMGDQPELKSFNVIDKDHRKTKFQLKIENYRKHGLVLSQKRIEPEEEPVVPDLSMV